MTRGWLGNRYVLVLGVIALGVGGWNAYVTLPADGVVEGRVVRPDGRPVAGARVTFSERTLTTLAPRATVETDADGVFRFSGQMAHHFARPGRTGPARRHRTCIAAGSGASTSGSGSRYASPPRLTGVAPPSGPDRRLLAGARDCSPRSARSGR